MDEKSLSLEIKEEIARNYEAPVLQELGNVKDLTQFNVSVIVE